MKPHTQRCHRLFLACALGVATTAAMSAAAPSSRPWLDGSLSPDRRASLALQAMTQDEKFRLIRADFGLNQNGAHKAEGALGSAGYIPPFERLGLPAIQESDAGLGVAKATPDGLGATSLPSGLATAASFDPQLAYAGGAMIGSEAHRKGFNVLLAGGVDLERDPRNGRNFEYAGEDPLLAGTIVGHAVRGVQDQHVVATVKHYAVNALETNRNTLSANIDPVAARNSDLLAFEIAIGIGHPGSVMCAYNRVNSVYACENDWLLNQVLKGDWHYPGYVMSDWGAVHGAKSSAMAGLDQESAGEVFDKQVYFDRPLRDALASGDVPQSRVDDMVHRILRSLFAAGVTDHPAKPAPIDEAADGRVAQRAEEEGAVLLRNARELLPLHPGSLTVAVIGGHADRGVLSGGGSSAVTPIHGNAVPGLAPQAWPGPRVYQPSSPLQAISRRSKGTARYDDGSDPARAARLAARADVAVVFVEQWAAESFDLPDMALPDRQDALVAAVVAANPRTIVVLENNGPVRMPWLDRTGAVLEAWYPGARGGEAIARLLFGEVAPSGRLPVSWPQDESQLPRPRIPGAGLAAIGVTPQGSPSDAVDYDIEGADVGYRWFQRRGTSPLFAFGYGLGYTQFRYGKLEVRWRDGQLVASFDASNRGRRDGVDVPQLYVTLPGTGQTRRLAGWNRITLKAGETRHVEIVADPRILADYGPGQEARRRLAGRYQVQLGHSATSFEGAASIEWPARR